MDEYKQGYFILWNAITKALEALQSLNIGTASALLLQSQIDAEEAYIAQPESTLQTSEPTES